MKPLAKMNQAIRSKETLHYVLGLAVDDDAPQNHEPTLTIFFVVACIAIFLATKKNVSDYVAVWGFSDDTKFNHFGFNLLTPFLLHNSGLDLFGNMVYLFVFGERVERALGSIAFGGLLVVSQILGEIGHLVVFPTHVNVGANGAVAGVLMYYALTYPGAKVKYQINYVVRKLFKNINRSVLEFPALIFLLLFLVFQIIGAMVQSAGLSNTDSWGNLGGLLGGLIFWFV